MNTWDTPELEELRDSRRKKSGRVAYDCFNLKQTPDGEVYCDKAPLLVLTVNLSGILEGITPSICRGCLEYDGGE